ncbi:MAG: L,D-transpeptidase family protein, partial [Candidatus Aphodocola sp.]
CALANLNLRKAPNLSSEVLEVIPKFSKLRKEKTNGTFDYISYDGTYGYVSHKYIEKLTNPYVEVDISDQTLWLYEDGDVKLEADVVTGKKAKYDTRLGCHKIYSKEKGRYLTGSDYKVWVDFWMPFDRGQGLHDASWRKTFNKDDYLNGSHGCVNMKYTDAEEVYNEVSVGTNVLVHE